MHAVNIAQYSLISNSAILGQIMGYRVQFIILKKDHLYIRSPSNILCESHLIKFVDRIMVNAEFIVDISQCG